MNWEAAGAIGEIFGALAVVVKLVYLSKQLRENTTSNRINSSWAMMQSFNSMHEMTVSNPDFAIAVAKAFAEEPLSPTERMQINSLVLHYLNVLVAAEETHRSGQLSQELWEWTKQDLNWTLQGGVRPFLINHLKILADDTIQRLRAGRSGRGEGWWGKKFSKVAGYQRG